MNGYKPHCSFQIRRGGKLAYMSWDPIGENYVEDWLLVEDLIDHMDATVCSSNETTVRDVILLMRDMNSIPGCLPDDISAAVDSIVEELFEQKPNLLDDNPLIRVELGWKAEVLDGFFTASPDLYGRLDDGDFAGVEFSPIAEIADLPVVLDDQFNIIGGGFESLLLARRMFTLRDVVMGFVSELSFFGTPQDRANAVADIREQIKQATSEDGEGLSVAEMFERVEAKIEKEALKSPCRLCGKDTRCPCFNKPSDICHSCFNDLEENT